MMMKKNEEFSLGIFFTLNGREQLYVLNILDGYVMERVGAEYSSLTFMSNRARIHICCETSTAFSSPRFVQPTIRIVSSVLTTALTSSIAIMDNTSSDNC